MQYSIVGNDIALIMHYRALLKRSGINDDLINFVVIVTFSKLIVYI